MKHKRLFVSFLPLYILGLLAAASCSSASNNVPSAGPADTAQPVQTSASVLPGMEGEAAMDKVILSFNGQSYSATLEDNPSAEAFAELLKNCQRQ